MTKFLLPVAALVKGDYIQCIEDVCKTKTSRFCLEEKQDTEIQRNIKADDNALNAKLDEVAAAQKRAALAALNESNSSFVTK